MGQSRFAPVTPEQVKAIRDKIAEELTPMSYHSRPKLEAHFVRR